MATRHIQFIPGEFYHVYNRGTDKRPIFSAANDWQRFQELLFLSNAIKPVNIREVRRTHANVYTFDTETPVVAIGAYCLMPNHFHILLTPLVDDGVSKFMNKLGTGYSMYFNKKYDRTGTLFEGPFKAKHADSDVYLKYLYAYIHLNPVKLWSDRNVTDESAADFLCRYPHASLADYVGINRPESVIVNQQPFPSYFATTKEQLNELKEWLAYRDLLSDEKKGNGEDLSVLKLKTDEGATAILPRQGLCKLKWPHLLQRPCLGKLC